MFGSRPVGAQHPTAARSLGVDLSRSPAPDYASKPHSPGLFSPIAPSPGPAIGLAAFFFGGPIRETAELPSPGALSQNLQVECLSTPKIPSPSQGVGTNP